MSYIPPSPSNIFEMFSTPQISVPKMAWNEIAFDIVPSPGFRFAYTDEGFDSTVVGSSDGGDAGPM